jgi:hypothetical protein
MGKPEATPPGLTGPSDFDRGWLRGFLAGVTLVALGLLLGWVVGASGVAAIGRVVTRCFGGAL